MAGWLFLIAMLTGVLVVLNAARPSAGPYSLVPSWLVAFLTTDLAFHHVGLQLLVAAGFIWAGALETLPGKLALVILVVSAAWIIILWLPNLRAAGATSTVADEFGLDEVETIPRALLWVPLRRRHEGVSVARDVEYSRAAGRVLTMDIYRGLSGGERRPALVFLHGGGWVLGDKCNQGLPLCNHLAKLGWVCANTNYRLSPGATWPDQAIDAKTAIAATGAISTVGPLKNYYLLFRESLSDMIGRRKSCIASSDNDDISFVASSQRFINFLVLKVDRFEPEVVDKIFVKIGRP